MRTKLEAEESPVVDMAPMIDCVFLLLIFFLVVATIRKKHNELPIELPAAETAVTVKPPDNTLVISIFKQGSDFGYGLITIGEKTQKGGGKMEEVSWDKLIDSLKQEAELDNKERPVRVDADKSIPYGKITQVIDHCQLYQFKKIGLRTRD